MTRIAFLTDSTAYLTAEQQADYAIEVVPLTVTLDGVSYREGRDITPAAYYRKLEQSKSFPTTSQPSIGMFMEVYQRLLETHDTVLGLLLSSGVSGTHETALQASRMVDGDIRMVDSKIASYGIAGPLLDGIQLARSGGSPDDVLRLWDHEINTMRAYFVVDTLEMLHRGGRIGGAAAVFGSLLQIKPILTLTDGRIELFEKIRTHRKAVDRIVALWAEAAESGGPQRVGIVHGDRLDDAEALRARLLSERPDQRIDISEIGPVIGSHTGAGVLAVIFYEYPNAMPQS